MGRPEESVGYSNIAEQREYHLRLLGTGAADPVVEKGPGMTVTRIGVGVFRVQFYGNPGKFVNYGCGVGSAIATDVKGYSVSRKIYDGANQQLDILLFDSANAAVELAATQYLDLEFYFSETQY